MHFDFAAALVLATIVTGVIWLLDAWLWAPKRALSQVAPEGEAKEPIIVEYAKSLFPVILVVLLLRSFLVEPFRIPSGSMMPTLLIGDFILVNKFAYGLRLPVLDTKFLDVSEPKRGDVVVFRYPGDTSVDYIKRVVALPGDRVAYFDKQLYINGEPMVRVPDGVYVGTGSGSAFSGVKLYRETFEADNHQIMIDTSKGSVEGELVVPDGFYFVMGDNRDHSNDSRYWGPVPEQNLVGKAFLIWMNWDPQGGIEWGRIGSSIR